MRRLPLIGGKAMMWGFLGSKSCVGWLEWELESGLIVGGLNDARGEIVRRLSGVKTGG